MLPFGGLSKSASIRPFIVARGQLSRLRHQADDPFGNHSMRRFHLKYCRVTYQKEGDPLVVENVEEIPDPFSGPSPSQQR